MKREEVLRRRQTRRLHDLELNPNSTDLEMTGKSEWQVFE